MSHPVSRLAANARTTIPKPVRDALGLRPGDTIAYELEPDGRVVLRKNPELSQAYLEFLDRLFAEWGTPEDAAAFDDLPDKRCSRPVVRRRCPFPLF
jgi:AbrB family looped-hinge helix DNA binding protein